MKKRRKLRKLRAERARLWEKFSEQGGRGIGIANKIDQIDREISALESA